MKSKKIAITLTDIKIDMLEVMMAEDNEQGEPLAGYIVSLIAKEKTRRDQDKQKKGAGRPRKDDYNYMSEEDEPRNIPHPDQDMNKGVMLTRSEYEAYQALKGGR